MKPKASQLQPRRPVSAMGGAPALLALARRVWRLGALLVVGLGIGLGAAEPPATEDATVLEYQVKAGFLFNFAKFVTWPASTNSAPTNLIVGVVDDGTAFPVIAEALAGKTVQGRTLTVMTFSPNRKLPKCDLLFVARTQERRVAALLEQVADAPVLTVSEVKGFAERGGCINFVARGEGIRFEVNLQSTERARLNVSSKIASMATLVRCGPPKE